MGEKMTVPPQPLRRGGTVFVTAPAPKTKTESSDLPRSDLPAGPVNEQRRLGECR